MRYTGVVLFNGFDIKLKIEEGVDGKVFVDDFVIRFTGRKDKLKPGVITPTEMVEIPYWVYAWNYDKRAIEFTRVNAEIYDHVGEYVDNLTTKEIEAVMEEVEDD